MKYLLSFAVGSILGDIFFHLIPESFQSHLIEFNESKEVAQKKVGLSILAGIFMFIIVEMVLEKWSNKIKDEEVTVTDLSINTKHKQQQHSSKSSKVIEKQWLISKNEDLKQAVGSLVNLDYKNQGQTPFENNNNIMTNLNDIYEVDKNVTDEKANLPFNNGCRIVDVAGYLSLIANGFDNFTHGLAIGASFLVGPKVGLLTTFVVFIHEIPHEICDYAILVNSGFSRWEAVKAQSSVSLFGILGTALSLYVKSVQTLNAKTVWILPFSAGGFLYIALVNLLPEILDRKTNFHNSLRQTACVILGIAFMAAVAVI